MAVDLTIYEEGSGGELQLLNDDLAKAKGLMNQVYLALFGGNVEQDTTPDLDELETRSDWWGNNLLKIENQFNSSFERTISQVALNSAGVRILENAIKSDLEFLKDYAEIGVISEITGLNKANFYITLQEPGKESIKLKLVWDGTREEAIINVTI